MLSDFKGLQNICNAFKIFFFHTYNSSNSILKRLPFSDLRKQQEVPEEKSQNLQSGPLILCTGMNSMGRGKKV